MKFENMNQAIECIESTLGITELQYKSGSFSYGQKDNVRMIAEYNNRQIEVRLETWEPGKNDELKMTEVANTQISKMAFFKLYNKEKKEAALRLANCILSHNCIKLNISDIDWDIEIALDYCGAHPVVGRRYMSTFNFDGKTTIPEGHYESLVREFYG